MAARLGDRGLLSASSTAGPDRRPTTYSRQSTESEPEPPQLGRLTTSPDRLTRADPPLLATMRGGRCPGRRASRGGLPISCSSSTYSNEGADRKDEYDGPSKSATGVLDRLRHGPVAHLLEDARDQCDDDADQEGNRCEQDADGYRMGWRWCSHGILSGLVRDQEAAGEAIGEQDPQVCCGVGEATVSGDLQVDLGQEISDAPLLISWRQIHWQPAERTGTDGWDSRRGFGPRFYPLLGGPRR